jgi:hypothetical protein
MSWASKDRVAVAKQGLRKQLLSRQKVGREQRRVRQ